MQHQHKLNGFPYLEFEKIGIDSKSIYNFRRNKQISEKTVLKKTFDKHFGCPTKGSKKDRLVMYYFDKIYQIKTLPLVMRGEKLREVRNHLYKTGLLFDIPDSDVSVVWEELNNFYLV